MGNEIYFGWIDLLREHDAQTRDAFLRKIGKYVVSINVEVSGVDPELLAELEQMPGVNLHVEKTEV